jgi:hypothetical protein
MCVIRTVQSIIYTEESESTASLTPEPDFTAPCMPETLIHSSIDTEESDSPESVTVQNLTPQHH